MFEGYRQASFRGVPFHCPERDRSGGRRVDAAEIPFADSYTTRDMGLVISAFNLSGFVFGADWKAQADRLEEALDASGAGRLVHPTRGELDVHVRRWSSRENEDEGMDFVRFRIECIPAKPLQYPRADVDQRARLADVAGTVRAPATASFTNIWVNPDAVAAGETLAAQSEGALNEMTRQLQDLARQVPNPDMGGLTAFLRDAEGFRAASFDLVRAPGDMASGVFGLVSRIRGLTAFPFTTLARLGDFGLSFGQSTYGTAAVPQGTVDAGGMAAFAAAAPVTVLQPPAVAAWTQANRASLGGLVAAAAVAEAAPAALDEPFNSFDDAVAARADLVSTIRDLEGLANVGRRREEALVYEDLRVTSWTVLGDVAADLPRLVAREVPVPQSARAFSWRARGDIRAAGDLVARNRLRHPAHLPAGTRLKLLDPEGAADG
ncbi:MAG TPA: hypothetical protein DIW51_00645 [Rhodospirillaceae bacterium]|nr:hypothetical protein [Rhodospirillaceae bacterium]HCS68457.1 hypothetical protein [Rhodospirillaceae bacterium]|tara:strand:+ start:372 stop:1676 length:1305 start_codon:yes stop_codon:yes gene_type:complete